MMVNPRSLYDDWIGKVEVSIKWHFIEMGEKSYEIYSISETSGDYKSEGHRIFRSSRILKALELQCDEAVDITALHLSREVCPVPTTSYSRYLGEIEVHQGESKQKMQISVHELSKNRYSTLVDRIQELESSVFHWYVWKLSVKSSSSITRELSDVTDYDGLVKSAASQQSSRENSVAKREDCRDINEN
ncbi:hypothetical protein Tco_0743317 [Tanacetum coccineum]